MTPDTDPTSGHPDRLRAAFTTQSVTMEDAALGMAFTAGLDWLVDVIQPRADDLAVDLAGGTGLVARHLAGRVRSIVVVDVTEAMLRAGRRAAAAAGLATVGFVCGDATGSPLPSAAFSLAVSRLAMHHVPDPGALFDELLRLTRPGGRIVVKDLVAADDETVAQRHDALEILRDDSHLLMLRPGEAARALIARGATVTRVARRDLDRPLEPWLEQARTPAGRADQVRRALEEELGGGPPTGLRPHRRDGQLWFRHAWEATAATR